MDDKSAPVSPTVEFHYMKGNFFRVIHADGAIGGPTPSGLIHMSLFSERPAIPQKLTHSLNADGTLGAVVETVTKQGVVREMEVDVLLTVNTARLLQTWLGEQIAKLNPTNQSN